MFRQLINEHKYEFLSLSLVALGTWYLYKIKRSKLDTNRQDLLDKIVLITGANCGIGYETALELARRGATLILACRDMAKCSEASEKIRLITKNDRIVCEQLDLSSFESVRHFALNILNNYDRIDILINNAGFNISSNFINDYSNVCFYILNNKQDLIFILYRSSIDFVTNLTFPLNYILVFIKCGFFV